MTAVDVLGRVDEPASSVDAVTGAAIRQVAAAGRTRFTVLGITNNELSPLVPLCALCLLVEVDELSFTDFYAAPIAVLNALVAEVARRLRRRVLGHLTQLDDLSTAWGYFLAGRRAAEL